MEATDAPLQCSFCGKTADQVQFLLSGGTPPTVYICGACVDIGAAIIEKTKASGTAPQAQ
jgi:ATP-dependent Clp protease ATP-binding subunit ClpX